MLLPELYKRGSDTLVSITNLRGGENLFFEALQIKNATKSGMMIKILGTVLDDLRKYYQYGHA